MFSRTEETTIFKYICEEKGTTGRALVQSSLRVNPMIASSIAQNFDREIAQKMNHFIGSGYYFLNVRTIVEELGDMNKLARAHL